MVYLRDNRMVMRVIIHGMGHARYFRLVKCKDMNACQTIAAGIKEGKQVFRMHFLKVRSEAAIFLQEHFAAFAANLVRWAACWLEERCVQTPAEGQRLSAAGVKELVQVAAHTSAWVI